MTIDVTCHCGKVLKVDPRHAGKKGRCKSCGATLLIPDLAAAAVPDAPPLIEPLVVDEAEALNDAFTGLSTDEDGVLDDVSRVAPLPPLPPPPPIVPTATASPKPASAQVPAEPWYYDFLTAMAMIILAIGVGTGGLLIVLSVLGFLLAPPEYRPRTAGGFVGLGISAAICVFSSLLTSAPILLAVDAARNLRAIRYQQ